MAEAEKMEEQSEQFTNMLHLLGDLCETSSKQILESIIKRLVVKPFTELRIEVLTNNAAKLSNYLFSMFKERPATELIKD